MPAERNHRTERHATIRELLAAGMVRSQLELVRRMRSRGIEATQSSVSRDLRELGAAKIRGRYLLPDSAGAPASPPPAEIPEIDEATAFVRAVRAAGPNLTVVLTRAGAAQRVALDLDRAGFPEVLGTVAGDDTIFVASKGAAAQRRLVRKLARLGWEAKA